MGKTKKSRERLSEGSKLLHHKSDLTESVIAVGEAKSTTRKKEKFKLIEEENFNGVVDDKLTKKILASAISQQEELQELMELQESRSIMTIPRLGKDSDEDEEEEWPALGTESSKLFKDSKSLKDYQEVVVDEKDEEALNTFMNPNPPDRRCLADIIMSKIAEKEDDVSTMAPDTESLVSRIHPRIKSVYVDVRTILQKYRSGKLPKAFKVIPNLKNWEEILYITEPESWSAAAMYQATRLFSSNMNADMAQRFYYLVLLPRIRDDIQYYKRLNFHLFSALKKTLFKPAAFFKGILLPLCEEGTCTLREATVIGSVMAKFSIPVLHSSAALLKIAEMQYNGANSIFLRILISKKYALPFRVIDALVFHFLSFRTERRFLPVLWHQCLLSFVEIYRSDISSEQIEALLELLRIQRHDVITPIIRQQLQTADCRDKEMDEPMFQFN